MALKQITFIKNDILTHNSKLTFKYWLESFFFVLFLLYT